MSSSQIEVRAYDDNAFKDICLVLILRSLHAADNLEIVWAGYLCIWE